MIDKKLEEQIASIVEHCGYQLWHCDYLPQGKHSILRVFIDHANGVGLGACEQVSRQISAYLDVEDPISGSYSLEVSSPGWPKPLYKAAHYRQFIGRTVDVKVMQPIDKTRKFNGIIEALDENANLILKLDNGILSIALSNIVKAQLTD
ncbi:ribosome maturation factor RimP [Legionella sp. W05-934-2]|uniref:ribosome maturation factor RimP n=1 Tax=Legionella sp. W05-934-2 TaxID=1198649 RepID=UPI003463666E